MKNETLFLTFAISIIAMSSVAQVKGTFTDTRDGKKYKTVKIGTQTWMAENLAYGTPTLSVPQSKQEDCHWTAELKDIKKNTGVGNSEFTQYKFDMYCNSKSFLYADITSHYRAGSGSWVKGQYYFYDYEILGYNANGVLSDINAQWITFSSNNDANQGCIYYEGNYIGKAGDDVSAAAKICVQSFNNKPKPAQSAQLASEICSYDNDENNAKKYGYLYTWKVAKTVCPQGWHLPSDDEWTTLINYLGGEGVAGGKMKENGPGWISSNEGATNSSGFTALPGGFRGYGGAFNGIGSSGAWWSSTEGVALGAWYRSVYYGRSSISRFSSSKEYGFSVRCLRDN